MRLEAEPVEVTDEDIQNTLKEIQEQTATWIPVERPSQLGDLISMTVTEKDGDEILAENESVEHELVALDQDEEESQPDLTTPLLGLSAGETKTFTVTYPEDFNNEKYAGKEITISAEVSGVKEKELDPLDDEFAQEMSDFETLDELKEDIRQNLLEQRQRRRDLDLGNELLDKILEDGVEQLEWPVALEEEEIDDEIERSERQLKNMGLTLDSYLQMQNKSKEEWQEELRPRIVNRLKRGLVLSKIAELEELEVSQAEILQHAKALADYSGAGDQLWQAILSSQTQQGAVASDVLSNKAILRLGAIARGEAPEPGAEDTTKEEATETGESEEEVVTEDETPEAEFNAHQEETETEISEQT
jgi:trigger factor